MQLAASRFGGDVCLEGIALVAQPQGGRSHVPARDIAEKVERQFTGADDENGLVHHLPQRVHDWLYIGPAWMEGPEPGASAETKFVQLGRDFPWSAPMRWDACVARRRRWHRGGPPPQK